MVPIALRAVPDEAERLLVVGAAAHVGAEERGRLALFLLVPRAALADEIAVPDAERFGGLQVFPQGRVLASTIGSGRSQSMTQSWRSMTRVAVVVRFDDRGLEVARAGQDRAEVLAGKAAALRVGAVEHEELVAAGGDAALDAEEVAKRRAVAVAERVPVVLGVARVHGPLAGLAQSFERDRFAGVRLGDRAAERELDGVAGGGRRLAEHQDDRRHEGITELNIVGVEAVSADQRHAIREEALEGRAVVDVHELRGDQPRGVPPSSIQAVASKRK